MRDLGPEAVLLDLEDANAFVVSLDPGWIWFRYHHLFADLLRPELRRTLPAEVPALHRRAAGWLAQQGQVAEAIRHTQAAGDWADAARLPGEARAALAALDEQEARSGEVRNALAVICLAEGKPAAALSALASVLDGTAPVIGYATDVEAHLAPRHHGAHTVLTGLLDPSALYGVLAEIEALGLDLLEIRKLTPDGTAPEPGHHRSP